MNTKKIVGVVTAASVLMVSFGGCSLLGGKDKQAVTDTASSYIDAVNGGKYNKSVKLVEDEEDYFAENELPSQQAELVNAVMGASEYSVENIKVNKDEATADVVFTMPDIESIADEDYSFDEFIDAIEDIDDTVEETVSFEFVKDGEDWLIAADSTEDYYNFLMDIGEGIEFSGLSEGAAIEAVDTFVALLANGDVEGAYSMIPSTDDNSFTELEDLGVDLGAASGALSSYFSALEYESEVTQVSENSITVTLTGTAPDAQNAVSAAFNDVNTIAPVLADAYESFYFGGTGDVGALYNGLFNIIGEAVSGAQSVPYSSSAVVTADDNGNLYVDPSDDFMFDLDDIDMNTIMGSDEASQAAFDILLSEGRISQSDYDMFVGGSDSSFDEVLIVVNEGPDFYLADYSIDSDSVNILVRTMDYYNMDQVFLYDLYVDDQQVENRAEYTMAEDSDDRIEIEVPFGAEGPAESYELIVYDQGADTVLADVFIDLESSENGAPMSGDYGFGTSMTYDNAGEDFYTFHFVDANGEYLDGESTYETNSGEIDFFVRTWDYYDQGDEITCQIYRDGEFVENIISVSEEDFNDTFNFSYAPDMIEDGDYTFVISDVNAASTLVVAYATVETAD